MRLYDDPHASVGPIATASLRLSAGNLYTSDKIGRQLLYELYSLGYLPFNAYTTNLVSSVTVRLYAPINDPLCSPSTFQPSGFLNVVVIIADHLKRPPGTAPRRDCPGPRPRQSRGDLTAVRRKEALAYFTRQTVTCSSPTSTSQHRRKVRRGARNAGMALIFFFFCYRPPITAFKCSAVASARQYAVSLATWSA